VQQPRGGIVGGICPQRCRRRRTRAVYAANVACLPLRLQVKRPNTLLGSAAVSRWQLALSTSNGRAGSSCRYNQVAKVYSNMKGSCFTRRTSSEKPQSAGSKLMVGLVGRKSSFSTGK
jgi:hypothetical protein